MKKTLLFGISAVLFTISANAMEYKPYVSAKVNYNMMKNDIKSTYIDEDTEKFSVNDNVLGGSVAAGIKAGMIRSELEGNIHQNAKKTKEWEEGDSSKFSVKNNSLMWNTYLDIPTNTPVTPYIGAGIGVARLKATVKNSDEESDNISKSSTNFAWQVGAGTAVEVTKNIAIDLGYRYVDNGSFKVYSDEFETDKLDSISHEIYLGMRYTF